ncbi:type II toxin-antitoxin system HicB family antitoxin [Methylobacterium oryzisoli]|uniref:type II toxin-antitoxin system HicB family antitoxin n=1 Tax=Methylobacterium oryzisoli TaxID=3385502 RepID=UPI0038927F28
MLRSFIALIHKDAGSDYGVSFPDLPGCISAGRTLDEARRMAAESLALHLDGMLQDGEAIPAPSPLDAIMADPENRDGIAVLVDAEGAMPSDLPTDLWERIDDYAARHGLTRADVLARGAERELASETA